MFVHTEKQKAKEIHCSSVLCEKISPYTSQKNRISPDLEGRIRPSLTNYDDFLNLCAGRGSDNQFAFDSKHKMRMKHCKWKRHFSPPFQLLLAGSSSSSPLVLLCFDLQAQHHALRLFL